MLAPLTFQFGYKPAQFSLHSDAYGLYLGYQNDGEKHKMHHFLVLNGQGWSADRTNMLKSLKEARRAFGPDVVCFIAKGHQVYWMPAADEGYFSKVLESEGRTIIARHDSASAKKTFTKEPVRSSIEGRTKVRHQKFGEGSIIHGEGTGKVLVQFATGKPVRMVESVLERV